MDVIAEGLFKGMVAQIIAVTCAGAAVLGLAVLFIAAWIERLGPPPNRDQAPPKYWRAPGNTDLI